MSGGIKQGIIIRKFERMCRRVRQDQRIHIQTTIADSFAEAERQEREAHQNQITIEDGDGFRTIRRVVYDHKNRQVIDIPIEGKEQQPNNYSET